MSPSLSVSLRWIRRLSSLVIATLVISTLVAPSRASAQSTYDGDLTALNRWQVAFDATSYPAPIARGGWVWINPRVYRGVTRSLELGAGGSFYSHRHGGISALQPSIKWRAWRDTTHALTVATGGQALVALARGDDSYGLAFVSVERAMRHSNAAAGAIAVGQYTLVGRQASSTDTRRGLIASAWEAVGPFRLSGSWIAGQNAYGSRVVTVTYTTPSSLWFSVGHSQGNAAWHNAGPYLSTGRLF